MKNKILPFISLLLLLIAVVAPTATAHANSADQKIRLTSAPGVRAEGSAKFRDRRGEQEFQVEVEVSRRMAGAVLTVFVDEVEVGQITVTKFGKGRLSLNSRKGDTVPAVQSGSLVGIVTANDDVILAGQF